MEFADKSYLSLLKETPLNDHKPPLNDVDLAYAILEYLVSHPHAADSADGVTRWWLGSQSAAATLPRVESALRQLVEHRALREERLADGTTLYSKN